MLLSEWDYGFLTCRVSNENWSRCAGCAPCAHGACSQFCSNWRSRRMAWPSWILLRIWVRDCAPAAIPSALLTGSAEPRCCKTLLWHGYPRNLPWHCALARSCERHVRASGFTFIFKLEGFCLKDCASPAAGFQRSSHWTINNRIKAKGISCRLQETFQELITVAYHLA